MGGARPASGRESLACHWGNNRYGPTIIRRILGGSAKQNISAFDKGIGCGMVGWRANRRRIPSRDLLCHHARTGRYLPTKRGCRLRRNKTNCCVSTPAASDISIEPFRGPREGQSREPAQERVSESLRYHGAPVQCPAHPVAGQDCVHPGTDSRTHGEPENENQEGPEDHRRAGPNYSGQEQAASEAAALGKTRTGFKRTCRRQKSRPGSHLFWIQEAVPCPVSSPGERLPIA